MWLVHSDFIWKLLYLNICRCYSIWMCFYISFPKFLPCMYIWWIALILGLTVLYFVIFIFYTAAYTHTCISPSIYFSFSKTNEYLLINDVSVLQKKKWIQCFIRHCFNVCVLNHLIFNCHLLLLSLIWVRNSVKVFWI